MCFPFLGRGVVIRILTTILPSSWPLRSVLFPLHILYPDLHSLPQDLRWKVQFRPLQQPKFSSFQDYPDQGCPLPIPKGGAILAFFLVIVENVPKMSFIISSWPCQFRY